MLTILLLTGAVAATLRPVWRHLPEHRLAWLFLLAVSAGTSLARLAVCKWTWFSAACQ